MIFSYIGGYIEGVRWESRYLTAKRDTSDTNIYNIPLIHCDAITSFIDVPTNANLSLQIPSLKVFNSYIAPPTSDNKNSGTGFYYESFNLYYSMYDISQNFYSAIAIGTILSEVFVKDNSTGYIYSAYLRDLDGVEVIRITNRQGNAITPYYNDFIVKGEPPKEVTSFYLSSPPLPIYISRGESIQLKFTEKYSDGTKVVPAKFVVKNSGLDAYGNINWTITGNELTITDTCWYETAFIRVSPSDSEDITYEFVVKVKDPVSPPSSSDPYLPSGGGISGGGNQSGISTVTGIFDGQPGPSIAENLPIGASGSDIASSGMYTKYLCNNALLDLLAEFFWEDNIGIQALKAVLGNPIDSIISLTTYPFALETLVPTTATTIYFGQYDSHFSAFSLTKSSFQIDWGTVTIPFFWGSFLDYSPYTKIQLYLPWGVGFVSIDPNEVVPWSSKNSYNKADFVNGTIRVVTNIELDKGACVHNIIGNNGRVIGSFGGVVGKQVPVTGSDNSARILAMMSAAISSSAAVGMAAGGAVAAGKNLAYGKGMTMAERAEGREMIGNYKSSVGGAIQSLSGGLASPPSYPRAGSFSDATNTLGYQYPYLIISRPSQSVPQQYGRFMGYPSNIFHAHLGEVRGYTEVSSIHLDNISATANELDELESILKGGVLL